MNTVARTGASAPERARQLGMAGLSAFERRDFPGALQLFEQAERLAHSPVFELYMARCLLALARPQEAHHLLSGIISEPIQADEPNAWRRARSRALVELALLPLPPPTEADSERPAVRDIPSKHRRAEVSGIAQTDPAQERSPRGTSPTFSATDKGAVAAYASGAIGLLIMIVAGTGAIIEASELKETCVDGSCPMEELPRAERAQRWANVATAGAVTALTGATVGTVLVLWPDQSSIPGQQALPAAAQLASPPRGRIELRLRALGLELSGTF